jgi:hypothetical protein
MIAKLIESTAQSFAVFLRLFSREFCVSSDREEEFFAKYWPYVKKKQIAKKGRTKDTKI